MLSLQVFVFECPLFSFVVNGQKKVKGQNLELLPSFISKDEETAAQMHRFAFVKNGWEG